MSLRRRLSELETQVPEEGRAEPAPWDDLLDELPELVLRILVAEAAGCEAETEALMALDPEETRRSLTAILDLVEDPDPLESLIGKLFDD